MKYTNNLNLKKPEPNDYFDQENHANYNMDVIDSVIASHLAEYANEVENSVDKQQILLSNPSPVYSFTAKRAGGIDICVNGEMLINLLGRLGEIPDLSIYASYASTQSLDTTVKKYGTQSIKVESSGAQDYFSPRILDAHIVANLSNTKNYAMRVSTYAVGENIDYHTIRVNRVGIDSVYGVNSTVKDQWVDNIVLIPKGAWTGINLYGHFKMNGTVVGEIGYTDGFAIYEISDDEYNAGLLLTHDELLTKYPYTNSAQPLMNPTYEVCGKNLFNKKDLVSGSINGSTGAETIPYSGRSFTRNFIEIDPLKTYYCKYNGSGSGININYYDVSGKFISYEGSSSITSRPLTIPATARKIKILLFVDISEKDNILFQLEEGTVATTYEPYKGGQIIFPGEYRKIGSYIDKAEYTNGKLEVGRNVKKAVLDGSSPWTYAANFTGYKRVSVPMTLFADMHNTDKYSSVAQKYDGKILQTYAGAYDKADIIFYGNVPDGNISITLSSTDTGWGNSYSPTADEIKAFFYGWKMYTATSESNLAATSITYDGTGTKAWAKIWNGEGAYSSSTGGIQGTGTATLPTTMNDQGYTPYQLYYALAAPIEEEIEPIILRDGFNVAEGINTIVAKSGYVYEKATPVKHNSANYYAINTKGTSSYSACPLKYKVKTIFKIIKRFSTGEKIDDTINWSVSYTASDGINNILVFIDTIKYDTTAEYYVLYEALPEEYNCQVQAPEISIAENLKNSYEGIVERLGNVEKGLPLTNIRQRNHENNKKSNDVHGLGYGGVFVAISANQSIPNATETKISFNDIQRQSKYTFYNPANPERLTIPKGVSRIRLAAQSAWADNEVGIRHMRISLNGGNINVPRPIALTLAKNNPLQTGLSTPLQVVINEFPVVEGDYFELWVYQNSGGALNAAFTGRITYLALEVIE